MFAIPANPEFMLNVVPGGPVWGGPEAGMTQLVDDQWHRWRQSPRTDFYQIRRGESGWPSRETGAPNMAAFGLAVEAGADLCAHCDSAADPVACTSGCLDALAATEDAPGPSVAGLVWFGAMAAAAFWAFKR